MTNESAKDDASPELFQINTFDVVFRQWLFS